MRTRLLAAVAVSAALLSGHPLGNFSVNHYARFDAGPRGVGMQYVIDLAEIPTFELMRDWGLDRNSSRVELDRRAAEQARTWMSRLTIRVGGRPVKPIFEGAGVAIADGAGGLPVLRISIRMRIPASFGRVEYEDHNYEGRAGWKEIVIAAEDGVQLHSASQGTEDRSQALTNYPPNPMLAPPQDLRAEFQWTVDAPMITRERPAAPVIRAIPQPAAKPAPPPSAMTAKTAPAGTVVRNDFLSRVLRRQEIPLNLILIALLVAFGLGAAHALTPGHGKTIVAAYLVGSRGTLKHAAFLGAMVTVTHTITVFALGLATQFLFRFIVPEKITEILGVISGLSIAVIGCAMLWKRVRGVQLRHGHSHRGGDHDHHPHGHDHHHVHTHDHSHSHDHAHDHSHPHVHTHAPDHAHHHGPGGHSHVPEGEISWSSLVTLAVSGGLVPCESALVLLLSAVAIGRVGLGLLLLVSFSLGLAGVLMGIGALVLYTKRVLPEGARHAHSSWARWVPVASAAVVMVLGVLMTGVSLGLLPMGWLVS